MELRIKRHEIIDSSIPILLHVLRRIEKAGGPVKILREDKFGINLSPLKNNEYRITGEIIKYDCPITGDIIYSWQGGDAK